jgi:hypothetical protein
MSIILNFSKWMKLHESEMDMESTVSGGNNYSSCVNNPAKTLAVLKSIISNNDVGGFWKLSNAVGGIIRTLGDLERAQRGYISNEVGALLGTKYPVTTAYFKKWAESTSWEEFTDLFKDEPGRAEGLTDDFKNDFNMPKLASRQ